MPRRYRGTCGRYDGDCPLCVREVDFSVARTPGEESWTSWTSRRRSTTWRHPRHRVRHRHEHHKGIEPNGDVITGVEVFERAYAAVAGWVYAFAKVPALPRRRTRRTTSGRSDGWRSMAEVRERRCWSRDEDGWKRGFAAAVLDRDACATFE